MEIENRIDINGKYYQTLWPYFYKRKKKKKKQKVSTQNGGEQGRG